MSRDADLEFLIGDLERFTEDTCIELSVNLVAGLTEDTPVDVGWARANWVPTLGAPWDAPDQLTEPTTADANRQAAVQQQAVAQILSFTLGDGVIFATNNVPYIGRLNDGWSKQAPAGFIEARIDRELARLSESIASNLRSRL